MVITEIGTITANKNKYFFQWLFTIDSTSFIRPAPVDEHELERNLCLICLDL
jgi:hypothetical protein